MNSKWQVAAILQKKNNKKIAISRQRHNRSAQPLVTTFGTVMQKNGPLVPYWPLKI